MILTFTKNEIHKNAKFHDFVILYQNGISYVPNGYINDME